jgi:hypothetical protein
MSDPAIRAQVRALPTADKAALGRELAAEVAQSDPSAANGLVAAACQNLSRDQRVEVIRSAVASLDEADRQAVFGPPSGGIRDWLWVVVIGGFTLVLVGSFVTLAVGVFAESHPGGVKPELILSMFTNVVGFLAGLFVPSPAARPAARS